MVTIGQENERLHVMVTRFLLGISTVRKDNTLMQLVPLHVDTKFRSFIITRLSKHTYAY